MNKKTLEAILANVGATLRDLDAKKEQTDRKIDYITEYTNYWLAVGCASRRIKSMCFIDGMANAGIYRDGDLGTASRLFVQFCEAAKEHPEMSFLLMFNDCNITRISILESLCSHLARTISHLSELPENLRIEYSTADVNDYIASLSSCTEISGSGRLTLLFVDPYDARTVNVTLLREFMRKHYCELFYNWFSSDLVRNKDDEAISACFEGVDIPRGSEAAPFVAEYLTVGKVRYHFSYSFRTVTNAELYQIIFVTPSIKGLEKLKEALWRTFNGDEFHRNHRDRAGQQISMFDFAEGADWRRREYGRLTQELIRQKLNNSTVSYDEIAALVLQRSLLREGDIIECVIKPMVEKHEIEKLNHGVSRKNYKSDYYRIGEN